MMSQFWTDKQVEELRSRAAAGENARTIGDAMGFTRNAVIGKLDRLRGRRDRRRRKRKKRRKS